MIVPASNAPQAVVSACPSAAPSRPAPTHALRPGQGLTAAHAVAATNPVEALSALMFRFWFVTYCQVTRQTDHAERAAHDDRQARDRRRAVDRAQGDRCRLDRRRLDRARAQREAERRVDAALARRARRLTPLESVRAQAPTPVTSPSEAPRSGASNRSALGA